MLDPKSTPPSAGYPPQSRAWFVTGTLTIAWIVAYLDRTIITLLTPALKTDLSLSDTQISLAQGLAFSLFFALAGLPIGRVVDRANRRNIIIAGVLCWSAMTLCCGLASTYWELLIARVGVGIGEACLAPASFSLLADYLEPKSRGKAIGIVSSGSAIGTAGSNILGGLVLKLLAGRAMVAMPLLGEIASWRVVFIIFAFPGLVVALIMLAIREPERIGRRIERSAPFLPYLRSNASVFFPIYGAVALNALVALGVTVWGPVQLIRSYHMSPGDAGLVMGTIQLVSGAFAGFVGGLFSDKMTQRHPFDGRLRVLVMIAPLTAVSVAMFSLPLGLGVAMVGYAGIKLSWIMMFSAGYAAVQELAPNEMRGQTIAVQALIINIVGMGAGPTLIALVTDNVLRDEQLLNWSILIVSLPASLLCWALARLAMRPARALREKMLGVAA